MNYKQLLQIKDLIKESGDGKYVIFNDKEPAFVIMGIDEYKNLIKTRKADETVNKDFIEKINRIIAEWRASQPEEQINDFDFIDDLDEVQDLADSYSYEGNKNGLSYYYDVENGKE